MTHNRTSLSLHNTLVAKLGAVMAQLDTSNSLDYEAIRNTISWYCIALDSKNFEMLNDVFTKDVNAKYPFGDGFDDCTVLADAIRKRCDGCTFSMPLACMLTLAVKTLASSNPTRSNHADHHARV